LVFENLSVYGMGGVKHFVKTFPDAFVDFFNVYGTVKGLLGKMSGTETAILEGFNGIVKPGEVQSLVYVSDIDALGPWTT
jgi:ATP-binding cassette, subfamily G (WHITE), member 2, SNQ2